MNPKINDGGSAFPQTLSSLGRHQLVRPAKTNDFGVFSNPAAGILESIFYLKIAAAAKAHISDLYKTTPTKLRSEDFTAGARAHPGIEQFI